MSIRGIRGAIDVPENSAAAIDHRTRELLREILAVNRLERSQIISVFMTATTDLNASYPAAAARAMGWLNIPLLDAQEIEVAGGMPRVIRVLMHVESDLTLDQIRHVYLGEAVRLRPDWAGPK